MSCGGIAVCGFTDESAEDIDSKELEEGTEGKLTELDDGIDGTETFEPPKAVVTVAISDGGSSLGSSFNDFTTRSVWGDAQRFRDASSGEGINGATEPLKLDLRELEEEVFFTPVGDTR